MKTFIRLLIATTVSLFVVSCASPLERRMQRNPDLFAKLSDADKDSVRAGRIKEGMSKEAVFFLWGHPSRVAEGTREGKKFERWTYTNFDTVAVHEFGFGFGTGWGYHRHGYYDSYYYGGPAFVSVPTAGPSVEFINGKVSGYLLPR